MNLFQVSSFSFIYGSHFSLRLTAGDVIFHCIIDGIFVYFYNVIIRRHYCLNDII